MIENYSLSFIYFFIFCTGILVVLLLITLIFELYKFFVGPYYLTPKISAKLYKDSVAVLEDARIKAVNIISSAHESSHQVIDELHAIDTSAKEVLKEKLISLTTAHTKELEALLSTLKQEYTSSLKLEKSTMSKYAKDLEDVTKSAAADLQKTVADEIGGLQDYLVKERERLLQQMAADLSEKRDLQLEALQKRLVSDLPQIAAEILGKEMTISDQETLITSYMNSKNFKDKYAQTIS